MTPPPDNDDTTTTDDDGNPRNDYDTVQISGSYDGARGNFRCTGICTVANLGGGRYTMNGEWTFRANKNATVSVEDVAFTHFGWWKQADLETDDFTFRSFARGEGAAAPALYSTLEGTYTYRGRAVGQYALYSPIAAATSSTGEFTANATLQASFDADGNDTISGRITGISGQPNWELTLNETTINGSAFANESDGVDWTIDGYKNTGGSWNGQFYFDEKAGAVPTTAVGAFIGDYDGDGRIIGAFGAQKR